MPNVIIDGEKHPATVGESLSGVLIRAGKAVSMPCGGRGTCGKCLVEVNGRIERACVYRIEGDADIEVRLPEKETILSDTGAEETGRLSGHTVFALDIGTTTLALAAVSADENSIVKVLTRANPQRAFGADVMSRIGYCTEHGAADLRSAVTGSVREMLEELCLPESADMYVAGNTTMLHLFYGVDCSGMGTAPYTPAFLESRTVSGESLGLRGINKVISLPGAAAFVGADLTAGLNYVGMPPRGRYRLLIDLGTNAEVVLYSEDSALCTAAAAGPCFEGANISCGMSASKGAVCAYFHDGYGTIGGAKAAGICGTGLVDVIAVLLEDGTIDETGFMECETFEIAPGVSLTQGDVREFQLAKSAIFSAVTALVRRQGISFEDIDGAYISGGFSAAINIDNAVKTGLLPAELRDKCVAVKNSSLLGTVKYACDGGDLSAYTDMMKYVDLAADPVFSDLFIENMLFCGD